MVGFEIEINGKIFRITKPGDGDGVANVMFTSKNEDLTFDIGGYDPSNECYIKWDSGQLAVGDKVHIKMTEIENVSVMQTSLNREGLLKQYQYLKEELTQKGLI